MALRSIFKGSLVLGRTKVPVKLYAAVEDRHVHFRFLSPGDQRPVTQQMVDTTSGKVMPSKGIRRGFRLEDGSYVLLSPDELKRLEPAASHEVRLIHRLPKGIVPPQWFVRPYYLGPDGSIEAYSALHQVLTASGDAIFAQWVMRGSEYSGVLRAEERGLSLTTLRHAGEVVGTSALEPPSSDLRSRARGGASTASSKEAAMARQLVEAFSDEFDPELFHDEYGARVRALVEAKRAGKHVRLRRVAAKGASDSGLANALSKSLKQAQQSKHRARPPGRASPSETRGSARKHKERSVA